MARSNPRNRTTSRSRAVPASVTPRTLFLAGLGAALLARRETLRLAADASEVPRRLRAGADAAVLTARAEVGKLAKSARTTLAPIRREVDRLGGRIASVRDDGVAEAAKRLNPLLARAGLPAIKAQRAKPRKASKPTAAPRRAARKTVGTARRRA